jgi:hypothetical protein
MLENMAILIKFHDLSLLFFLSVFLFSCKSTYSNLKAPEESVSVVEAPIVCDQPGDLSYSMVDIFEGISFVDEYHINGPWIAVADFDKDGNNEVIYCFPDDDFTYIYKNGEMNVLIENCGPMLLTDVDNDGWLDFLMKIDHQSPDWFIDMWRNSNGTLLPHTSFSIGTQEIMGMRSGDFNNDDHPDLLFIRNNPGIGTDQDTIAMWTGDWTYEVSDDILPAEFANRKAFDATVIDVNQDGWVDIYVGNDQGGEFGSNVLWWNREGTFEPASDECGCTPTQESMGVDIADFNHDGLYDILSSDTHKTHLLMGLSPEEFVDVSTTLNANVMEEFEMTWGVRFADLDNDGVVELLQAQGDLYYPGQAFPQHYGPMSFSIARQSDGLFTEIQDEIGVTATGSFRSIIPLHWNQDGVLDLLITDVDQAPLLYVSNNCTENNYISFTGKEGTKVRFKAGGESFVGELHTGSSFGASQEPLLHFGLGSVEIIEDLEIQYRGQDWMTFASTVNVPQRYNLNTTQ